MSARLLSGRLLEEVTINTNDWDETKQRNVCEVTPFWLFFLLFWLEGFWFLTKKKSFII